MATPQVNIKGSITHLVREIKHWMMIGAALVLAFVVLTMLLKVGGAVIGAPLPLNPPAWTQENGIMIAALAYALGKL